MAHPQLAVFARLANGIAETVRKIEGQNTLFQRGTHAVFYDEIHDEIVVPGPIAQSVMTAPPEALRYAKQCIDRGVELDPHGALGLELLAIEAQLASGKGMGKT